MRFSLQCNRFTLFGFVASIVLTLPLLGTEDPTYRVLGGIGYRSTAPTIIASPASGVFDTTSYSTALMPLIDVGLGVQYPLSSMFAIRGDVSYMSSRGDVQARREIIIAVDGQPVQGTLRQDAAITADVVNLDLGLCVGLHPLLSIDAIVGVALPMAHTTSVNQVLESPAGVTFVDGGSSTRLMTNTSMSTPQTMMVVGVNLRSRLRIVDGIDVEPIVATRLALTSADGYGWRPFSISLGVAIAYTPTAPHEDRQDPAVNAPVDSVIDVNRQAVVRERIIVTTSEVDTVTIVDSWSRDRRDTVYTRRSHQHSDTVRGIDTDTIVLREHITIEEHLPGAPPFLSSVLRVDLPATVIDTAADVMVHVNVVSDTQSTTLVEVWHNDSVVHQRTLSLGSGVVMFRLTDVLADITRRDNVTLRVTARTTDAVGQTIDAAPRIITLRRSGGRRLRTR